MSFPRSNNDTRGKRPANPAGSPGPSRASSSLSSRPISPPSTWRSSDSTLHSRGSGGSALKFESIELGLVSPPHGLSATDINELLNEFVPAQVLTAKRLERGDTRFSGTAEPLRAIDEGSGSERSSSRGNDTANAARTEHPTTGGPCDDQSRSSIDQEAYPRGAQETSASRHATPEPVHGDNPGWTEPPTTHGPHDDHANLINQEARPPGAQDPPARRNAPNGQASLERAGPAIGRGTSSSLDRPKKSWMKAVVVATLYIGVGGIAMAIRIGAGIVPPTNEHNGRITDILDSASNTVICVALCVRALQEAIKTKGASKPFMFWSSVILGVAVLAVIGTNWGLCFGWRTPRGRNVNNQISHATDYAFLMAAAYSIVCAALDEKTLRDEESAADQLADN